MRRYLRLYAYFLRFSFSRAMQFRLDFFFRVGMDTLWYAMHLTMFAVLYRHTPEVGGWNRDQMWVFLGGVVPNGPKTWGGLPDIRTFLLPAADYRIEDTWHTAGMVGTGSHDVVVDGAFVPEHRTLPFANLVTNECAGWAANPAPLYRAPFAAMATSIRPCVLRWRRIFCNALIAGGRASR